MHILPQILKREKETFRDKSYGRDLFSRVGWGWVEKISLGLEPLRLGDRKTGAHETSLPTYIYLRFSEIKSLKRRLSPTKTNIIS